MLMLNNLILPSLLTQLEMLRHTRRVDWPGVPPGNQTLTPTHIWSSALYGSTIVKIQIQIRSDPHTHSHVIFFPLFDQIYIQCYYLPGARRMLFSQLLALVSNPIVPVLYMFKWFIFHFRPPLLELDFCKSALSVVPVGFVHGSQLSGWFLVEN